MAELCSFCGKKLTLFDIDTLTCGDVSQPACADCAEKYVRVSQIERCRGLLNGEWAREPERVRTFLERAEKRKRELEEWREKASRCPACGAKMELKLKKLLIGLEKIMENLICYFNLNISIYGIAQSLICQI